MKKLTDPQAELLRRLERYGHIAIVSEDNEEAFKFLRYAEPDYDAILKDDRIDFNTESKE